MGAAGKTRNRFAAAGGRAAMGHRLGLGDVQRHLIFVAHGSRRGVARGDDFAGVDTG